MSVFKANTTIAFILLLNLPLVIYAVDCNTILAKLPAQHSSDVSDLVAMIDNFEKTCKERQTQNPQEPDIYNQCILAGMRSMAVSGNFIAAEKMAKIECAAGNDTISKNWMGLVLSNNRASENDKAVAQEAVDNIDQ